MLAQTLPKPDMDPVCCPAVDRPGGECRVLLQWRAEWTPGWAAAWACQV